MIDHSLRFVICGLALTSSWGNSHASTYRALVRELTRLGHDVLFLERDQPWYAANRDLPEPPYGRHALYSSTEEFKERFTREIAEADIVIVGSFVPDGIEIGRWVISRARGITAFYDLDTPVTFSALSRGETTYISPALISLYDLYLSVTGGPILRMIEDGYGSPKARVLYCSAEPREPAPENVEPRWDLGYLGTYSVDRQPTLEKLLIEPARQWSAGRFVVAGPQYPDDRISWNENIERIPALAPQERGDFYRQQRFTLNITRRDMLEAGYSPSTRLFEAAACGVPIISYPWAGIETIFKPKSEILLARNPQEILEILTQTPEEERIQIAQRARERVLSSHTSAHRAAELEFHVKETLAEKGYHFNQSRRASWKASYAQTQPVNP